MISTETPYKLVEIIRDTWPGVYIRSKTCYNKNSTHQKENGKKY